MRRFTFALTQSFGKVKIDLENIDMLCFSGHKIYGPKGVGALFVKKGVELTPLVHGGGQQNGFRSGTHNVAGIVGLGKAVELAFANLEDNYTSASDKMEAFRRDIKTNSNIHVNGEASMRSPYILNLGIEGKNSDDLLKELDQQLKHLDLRLSLKLPHHPLNGLL